MLQSTCSFNCTDKLLVIANFNWQIMVWSEICNWQLAIHSKFCLTIHVLMSTSILTFSRWQNHVLISASLLRSHVLIWTSLLSNHVSVSASLFTTDRWFQILSNKQCFDLNILTGNYCNMLSNFACNWKVMSLCQILSDK